MKLALGSVQFGLKYGVANQVGQVQSREVDKILCEARNNGVDTIDTAISYGNSEKVLGNHGVSDLKVITKITMPEGRLLNPEVWIKSEILASIKRLKIECLYGVLLHSSSCIKSTSKKRIVKGLEELKLMGITKKIGISVYNPNELDFVMNEMDIDLVQAPVNILDRRLEFSGWLRRLYDLGVEIHARSIFLQGLLLLPRSKIPKKFERWSDVWNKWHEYINDTQIEPLAVCLNYPLSLPEIERVIIGVDSVSQLREIIRVYGKKVNYTNFSLGALKDQRLINPSSWGLL